MPNPLALPSNDEELGEHIAEFEAWFTGLQRAHGLEASSLMMVERAIIRAHIKWLQTREADAPNPAQ